MPLEPNGPGPYTSTQAVLTVLEKARVQLPPKITADTLIRYGIKESIVPRTMSSLRLLDLIDENGNRSSSLEALSAARPDQYKLELATHVRSVYAEIFAFVDPSSDDVDAIRNAFWGYEPRGQIDAMVRLFVGLCEAAGIVETNTRVAASTPRKATKREPSAQRLPSQQIEAGKERGREVSTVADGGIPPGLVGLLRQVPTGQASWTTKRRDEFLVAFTAVLNFTVPVDDDPKIDTTTGDDP